MAQVVPELVYRDVVRAGLEWVKRNQTRIDSLLAAFDSEAIQNFRDYMAAHTIEVVQGWPRNNTPLPCIAIILMQESDEAFIGDDIGFNTETEPQGLITGRLWGGTHLLLVVSENADLTLFLYYILKSILQLNSQVLQEYLHEVSYDAGDLQPNLEYLPDTLYTRGISIQSRYFDAAQINLDPVDILRVVLNIRETNTAPFGEGVENPLAAAVASTADINIYNILCSVTAQSLEVSGYAASTVFPLQSVTWEVYLNDTLTESGTCAALSPWTFTATAEAEDKVLLRITATNAVGVQATKEFRFTYKT